MAIRELQILVMGTFSPTTPFPTTFTRGLERETEGQRKEFPCIYF